MDDMRDIEIRVLRDVVDAVERRLRAHEAEGGYVLAPRAQVYAAVIYAVIASARASGHYGAGSLARAALLDEILGGVEANPWEAAIYAVVMDGALIY
ncbi:hypothetical protein [Nocardia concava]|uniref:hypothetical protein n=1 Tax=Nocardia concava TaxID=257281 RepID=UPI00030D7A28|nr:hypothetical protein [Nocardia concava]